MAGSGAACTTESGARTDSAGTPVVLVSTSLLSDVVSSSLASSAIVEPLMAAGTDPHDFVPSAKQVAAMYEADVLVLTGGAMETNLAGAIEAVSSDGVAVCTAMDHLDEVLHHASGTPDPHFLVDPQRTAQVTVALAGCIADAAQLSPTKREQLADNARRYASELLALDTEIASILETVPTQRRRLVSDHLALDYFAERYDFDIVGTVLGPSTHAETDAKDLAELARIVRHLEIPAVFTEAGATSERVDTLATEVNGLDVVELHTESLAPRGPTTYAEMLRSNSILIAEALGGP